jgi:membrane-bound lytic murein transglycosylase D
MPVTAKAQGLSLLPFDERTNPEKSARAAATLLKRLHGMFNSWPLALAAYNAGEGRVRRTLKAQDATTFAQIADALPSETRLYVPKVLATLAVREGLDPATLAAPQK